MGKEMKKPDKQAAGVKRVKVLMICALLLVVLLLTAVVVILAQYNIANATIRLSRTINFVVLFSGYFAVFALSAYSAFHRYEEKIKKYIDTDRLTSGINYEKFLREAADMIQNKDEVYAVFYGDILNFKYINDTFGYDIGDKLLMYISQKIRDAVTKENGLYARITADNYTAIVPYKDKNEFVESIYSLIDDICWFEDIQAAHYKPEIYVGIYCSGDDDKDLTISEMIDRANMAEKSVKGSSEYHIAFFTEEIRERVIAEKELERKMESALANGEFKAYFQPKYQVSTGEIVGAEALVRWDSPESGFMSPGKFIPLFEQNGFIINLDQYVFETVCKNMRDWIDSGIKVVPVSVNVSRLQFYKLDFVKRYTKIKEKYNIPDGLLELEFTESIVFENLDILRKIVLNLKKAGFSCSIDDFGSGYSSLNILKNLPMDTLKLDRLFFCDTENVTRDKALISSVINMSRALNMKTVAEGIESWAQVAFLKEIGCDVIQGYVYSEPIPHARFTNLLEGNRRKVAPSEVDSNRRVAVAASTDDAIAKYTALVGVLEGMLVEVDYNTGHFELLNIGTKNQFGTAESLFGDNFDSILRKTADKFVHKDDIETLISRSSTVSVMSTFYQGETKIITEIRVRKKKVGIYEWYKMTIARLDPNPEHNDFRALLYIEPTHNTLAGKEELDIVNASIRSVFSGICPLSYEIDAEKNTFTKVFCNEEQLGEHPDEGELSWFYECYLSKIVSKECKDETLKFVTPSNIMKELIDKDKKQITMRTCLKFKGIEHISHLTITKISFKNGDEEAYKLFLLINVENQKKAEDK